MLIEITSPAVEERHGNKNGRDWSMRTQSGYAYTLDQNGGPKAYPELIKIDLAKEQPAYQPGKYLVADGSFFVGDFGKLSIGRLVLAPAPHIDMGKLITLFNEKTDFLHRAAVPETLHLADLPKSVRLTYAAYMRGEDVSQILSTSTLRRHAKALDPFGVDIRSAPNAQRLNTRVREIQIVAAQAPEWYWGGLAA